MGQNSGIERTPFISSSGGIAGVTAADAGTGMSAASPGAPTSTNQGIPPPPFPTPQDLSGGGGFGGAMGSLDTSNLPTTEQNVVTQNPVAPWVYVLLLLAIGLGVYWWRVHRKKGEKKT